MLVVTVFVYSFISVSVEHQVVDFSNVVGSTVQAVLPDFGQSKFCSLDLPPSLCRLDKLQCSLPIS